MSKGNANFTLPSACRSAFAERLSELTKERGSVPRLAEKIGASVSAVRKWANDETEPSRDYLVAMSEALDVNLLWLVTGEGPKRDVEASQLDALYQKGVQLADGGISPEDVFLAAQGGMEPSIMDRSILAGIIAAYLETKGDPTPVETAAKLLEFHDETVRFLRNAAAHGISPEGGLAGFLNRVGARLKK